MSIIISYADTLVQLPTSLSLLGSPPISNPYARRLSRSRHDIGLFLAISNSAHEVRFGDSLAGRLTLADGREIYRRERAVGGEVRRDIVGEKIHMVTLMRWNIDEMEE